uniref:Uncharacterized protein n=1 Tax=Tanacetum cinerariifolium TaxID=118510 RepID=A0A699I7L7_TANCI|nr:hypothetical protein [Tanacetum cinerariifolium]
MITSYDDTKNGDEKRVDDPTLEPSYCKIRRFEMMKYSCNDDEEYITIKESEYLNHSKDSLDAYQELLPYGDEDSDDAISNDEGDKNQNSNIFGDDDDAEDGQENQVNEDPIEEGEVMINEEASDNPFKIYPILNDKTKNMAGKGSSSSYTHPPGFSHMKGQEDKQGMENNNT